MAKVFWDVLYKYCLFLGQRLFCQSGALDLPQQQHFTSFHYSWLLICDSKQFCHPNWYFVTRLIQSICHCPRRFLKNKNFLMEGLTKKPKLPISSDPPQTMTKDKTNLDTNHNIPIQYAYPWVIGCFWGGKQSTLLYKVYRLCNQETSLGDLSKLFVKFCLN